MKNIDLKNIEIIKSGAGYDLHLQVLEKIPGGKFQIGWYCWNFNKDFFEALQQYGLPPTDLDYNKLMEKLSEN